MARKTLTAAPVAPVYGAKTAAILKLAMRPQGVSGAEITAATFAIDGKAWAGSAGWRVGCLADMRGLVMSDRIYRDDAAGGRIGYSLTDPTKAVKAPRRKVAVAAE